MSSLYDSIISRCEEAEARVRVLETRLEEATRTIRALTRVKTTPYDEVVRWTGKMPELPAPVYGTLEKLCIAQAQCEDAQRRFGEPAEELLRKRIRHYLRLSLEPYVRIETEFDEKNRVHVMRGSIIVGRIEK